MEYLTTKKWKRMKEQNTKGHGHKGVEECERGQPRLSQHPASVDLKYGRLSVFVLLGKGCLMCHCHGNCSHNAGAHFLRTTTAAPQFDPPPALSTHLRRHDRSCCYFWLLLAISVVCFSVVVHFVFFFSFSVFLPQPAAFPLK